VNSDLGAQYLLAMSLAGAYAYAGRDWVCDRVAKILGAEIVEVIHNYHNFAWHEKHGDEMFWVVRKGATPAFPGEKGFVDGSMGEQSVILEGVENEDAKYSLYSTVLLHKNWQTIIGPPNCLLAISRAAMGVLRASALLVRCR
jgi:tRNA-splicing ligase RtcB